MNKSLNLLTICRKAGKLTLGMDPVKDSINNNKAICVLIAEDVSLKSRKEILFVTNKQGVKTLELDATKDDVWKSLGKKAGILSVEDSGFAKKLSTLLLETTK